jgi:hypothetical protein
MNINDDYQIKMRYFQIVYIYRDIYKYIYAKRSVLNIKEKNYALKCLSGYINNSKTDLMIQNFTRDIKGYS